MVSRQSSVMHRATIAYVDTVVLTFVHVASSVFLFGTQQPQQMQAVHATTIRSMLWL
jgi:hypothetical protein